MFIRERICAPTAVPRRNPRQYAMRYILRGGDPERVEAYESVGFRYLSIVARGGAEIESAGAIERRYPRSDEAYFECDDPALNKIWRVGARTLELCSTDAFIDCPGREQRAWLGDSYIHALLTYTTNTDWRLVRRHLRICAQSRRGDGLLAMAAACDFSISSTTIPDYSLHWIRALARYFEYSGDAATVRELMPTAAGVVSAFERYRAPDELIRGMPGWIFIDWAMTERSEVTGALDALYAAALDDYASLAESVMQDSRTAGDARAGAARTRRAFELLWDDAAGVYVDAADPDGPRRRVSQHTNAIAIVAGCAPRERWPRMLDYILDESRVVITPTISDNLGAYLAQRMDPAEHMTFDVERHVVAAQPFFSHIRARRDRSRRPVRSDSLAMHEMVAADRTRRQLLRGVLGCAPRHRQQMSRMVRDADLRFDDLGSGRAAVRAWLFARRNRAALRNAPASRRTRADSARAYCS